MPIAKVQREGEKGLGAAGSLMRKCRYLEGLKWVLLIKIRMRACRF